jgi:ABC-type multidrug transport system permease subunit
MFEMAFSSWLLSNVLGILLVLTLAVFLYGLFAELFSASVSPGSDPRISSIGPCLAAGLIASIIGGFLTARMRVWLERE